MNATQQKHWFDDETLRIAKARHAPLDTVLEAQAIRRERNEYPMHSARFTDDQRATADRILS